MEHFEVFWRILCEAFPESEHRSREDHLALLDKPFYQLNTILKEDEPVGFWSLWDLEGFVFMEHLAVDAACRGEGHGTAVFRELFKTLDRPLVLEVERPDTAAAVRRIALYQRLGLHLNPYDYVQPPLQKGQETVPMHLMTWPSPLSPEAYEAVRDTLYALVYDGFQPASKRVIMEQEL